MKFTKENSREYRRLAAEAKARYKAQREAMPDLAALEAANAQTRNARLWVLLGTIDKRIAYELTKACPNGALLRDLAATAKTMREQTNGTEPNGKPAARSRPAPTQAPELAPPIPASPSDEADAPA